MCFSSHLSEKEVNEEIIDCSHFLTKYEKHAILSFLKEHQSDILTEKETQKTEEKKVEELLKSPTSYDMITNKTESSQAKTTGKLVGRNDLCPCGSGKKYKKCCGKSEK